MSRPVSSRSTATHWPSRPRPVGKLATPAPRVPLLPDTEWRRLALHLVSAEASPAEARAARQAAQGALLVLRRGCRWSDLPTSAGSARRMRRQWRAWLADGRWVAFWLDFVGRLDARQCQMWTRALARAGERLATEGRRRREDALRAHWWLVSTSALLERTGDTRPARRHSRRDA